MENTHFNSADPHPRQRVAVLDTEISYVDTGLGDPIVFLHGNPTSSYLWRNIIPYLSKHGRCVAPDLMGMGQSGKSPKGAYRFVDHARYLDAWFEALHLTSNVTLVVHDWGSALGFYRAFRYPGHIRAIAYMEAIAMPLRWQDFGEARGVFQGLRSSQGEQMILDGNFFVEECCHEAFCASSAILKWPPTARRFSSGKPGCRCWSGHVKFRSKVSRPM